MKEIFIRLLTMDDSNRLFEFETENRSYFERIGLPRSKDHYNPALFQKILEELVAEQERDMHYMYLVLNVQGEVIGRVNLTDVIRGPLNKAELGYRIGEKHQGRGYATTAVSFVIEEAGLLHKLHRLEAGTSPENIGSQIVLIKNGFQFVGKYNQYIFQGNRWVDSLIFEKVLSKGTQGR